MKEAAQLPDEIVMIVTNLIKEYLQRQRIVVQVMIHFRPTLIRSENIDKQLGIDIEPEVQHFWEHYYGNPDIFEGIWNEEWRYKLHGIGCRLHHLSTGEALDWDVGPLDAFYVGWFANHLHWRIEHQPESPNVKQFLRLKKQTGIDISTILDYMIEQKILLDVAGKHLWQLAELPKG